MKTYLFFCICVVLYHEIGYAQTLFAPDGAVWHYDAGSMVASGGYCRFDVSGDTLIDGNDCKKINGMEYYYYPAWDIFDTVTGPEFFTFTDEDRVYFYMNNQLDTLFDFSLQTGDTYKISFGDYCDTAIVQITETGTITMNDMELRYYNAETISDLESTWAVAGTMVERIGSLGYLLGNPACVVDDDWAGGLRCYSDLEFGSYESVEEGMCDFIIGIDWIGNENHQPFAYPNPVQDKLNIVGKSSLYTDSVSIELVNMQGQLLNRFELTHCDTTCSFDVSALAPGTYLLALRITGEILRIETIIVE